MILRTTPEFFCPLPTNILKVNFDEVGLFFFHISQSKRRNTLEVGTLYSHQNHNRPHSATWSNYHLLMSHCALAEFMRLISDSGKIVWPSGVLCTCRWRQVKLRCFPQMKSVNPGSFTSLAGTLYLAEMRQLACVSDSLVPCESSGDSTCAEKCKDLEGWVESWYKCESYARTYAVSYSFLWGWCLDQTVINWTTI